MHSGAVPGLLAKIRIFSAPAEAERRLRIVYLSCFCRLKLCCYELFLFALFLLKPRNISSAGQLHEQTRMREEEARQTKF